MARLRLTASKTQIESAIVRLQGAFPKMFEGPDVETQRARMAEYKGFFSRLQSDEVEPLLTQVIRSSVYPPTIAHLEKLRPSHDGDATQLPEEYRECDGFWTVWYARYWEIAADVLQISPETYEQNLAIERLVQLFRDRLSFPQQRVKGESRSAIDRHREFAQHLRDCVSAFEQGGAEGFRDVWNRGSWLLEGQGQAQRI